MGFKIVDAGVELPVNMKWPRGAVMMGQVYLCFWDSLYPIPTTAAAQKCMSASGPLEEFTEIGTNSTYPHYGNAIASNNGKLSNHS